MKLADPKNPVRLKWLSDQGLRLDASSYLSGAFEMHKLLERMPGTQPLNQLVRQPLGIFHAGRVTRRWVSDSRLRHSVLVQHGHAGSGLDECSVDIQRSCC